MILPDVTVLVYAFREVAPEHAAYASWLNTARQNREQLLLPDVVLVGFLRIVTNGRIFAVPAPLSQTLAFITGLRAGPGARTLDDVDAVWQQMDSLAVDRMVRGNLVPDAYLAAVALSHKARLATRDRGFARYPGLRWFDPAATAP